MASLFNLNILQGSDFTITVIANDDFGAVIDLTGYSASALAKFRYGGDDPNVSLDLNASIPTSTEKQGEILISLSQTDTAAFPVMQGIYEVEIIKGDTGVKIISGLINISPQITT